MDYGNGRRRDDHHRSIRFRSGLFSHQHCIRFDFHLYGDAGADRAGGGVDRVVVLQQYSAERAFDGDGECGRDDGEFHRDGRNGGQQSDGDRDGDRERNFEDGYGDGDDSRAGGLGSVVLAEFGCVGGNFHVHRDAELRCSVGRGVGRALRFRFFGADFSGSRHLLPERALPGHHLYDTGNGKR